MECSEKSVPEFYFFYLYIQGYTVHKTDYKVRVGFPVFSGKAKKPTWYLCLNVFLPWG